jgi:toxin FitB
MTFLLDTNVLSEMRRPKPDTSVIDWITATPPHQLHVSVLTLGEIKQGIARVRGRGDQKQTAALERWLRGLEAGFAGRILPVTLPVATAWGREQYGRPLPVVDALIAATAQANALTMVTRNAKDFQRTGLQVLNPFTTQQA